MAEPDEATDDPKLPDIFSLLEPLISSERESENPWKSTPDDRQYVADLAMLESVLAVPVGEGTTSQTGRLAKTVDTWVSYELRRAGFRNDEVWPRLSSPRVLPRDIADFIDSLPRKLQDELRPRLLRTKKVAPSDAKILGRAYVKQVDVLIAHWSRGAELLVSTKTMVSSYGKNLANRFEEAYGDAKNLRGRYPLASMGFLFLLHSSVRSQGGALDRAIDMMRKLKAETDVYDATCLLVVDWSGARETPVRVLTDKVPNDLSANAFLSTLVEGVLSRTPVDMHTSVRERYERRDLELDESDA